MQPYKRDDWCFWTRPEPRADAGARAALQPGHEPIEQVFAKLKTLLSKTAARTQKSLWHAIGCNSITSLRPNVPTTSDTAAMAAEGESALEKRAA